MIAALLALLLIAGQAAPPATTAAPASAETTLRMGRTMLVRLAGDPVVQSEAAASSDRPWTAQDAASLGRLIGPASQETLRGVAADSAPTLPHDGVRFTLLNPSGRNIMLLIDNGTSRRVRYTAQMELADGRVVHTNVCDAPAGRTFYEHWTDPIVALRLRVVTTVEDDGGPPHCEPPVPGPNQEGGAYRT